jgi:oxygen-independent coproporphyrinogen-3 oxidase
MGVQSFNPEMLARLGRVHTREMIFKSYDILRAAGIENVSIDLMFAIPGQTMEMWRESLAEAFALHGEHLSCYELIYEEDTPFFEQLRAGRSAMNEDLACAMYEELLTAAASAGFAQYEVANFARIRNGDSGEIPQLACRHNVNYWRGGWYHGLGPSAAAYVDGARTRNRPDTLAYCEALERGERAFEYTERLSPARRAGELAAFGLRMTAGWPLDLFKQRTGFDMTHEWSAEIEQLTGLGYAVLEPGRFRLTSKGIRFADWAAELFLR